LNFLRFKIQKDLFLPVDESKVGRKGRVGASIGNESGANTI
jgi:hypothetical protein